VGEIYWKLIHQSLGHPGKTRLERMVKGMGLKWDKEDYQKNSGTLRDMYTSEKCEESEPEINPEGIPTIEESLYGFLGSIYPHEEPR
jgi:hypothetical protein